MSLYENQQIYPIELEGQVPDNRVAFSKIVCIPRGACLVMQTGTDSNGKRKKQKEIWGTVTFELKLSSSHIFGIIGGDLQMARVSFWRKRVQEIDTRADFFPARSLSGPIFLQNIKCFGDG